jgi:hypothetical protein
MRLISLWCLLIVALALSFARPGIANVNSTTRPSDLALEIEALRAMQDLQITSTQLQQFSDAYDAAHGFNNTQVADTGNIDKAITTGGNDYFLLLRLRQSLLNEDARHIESAEKELAQLEQRLRINLTPRIVAGSIAQRSAVKLATAFSGWQVADYIARRSDEVSDPTEVLVAALTQCRGMSSEDFQVFSMDVAQEISELVAGLTSRDKSRVQIRAANLIHMAYALDDDAFSHQRPNLEKEARDVARVDASVALQHWIECEIAQLLANPKLKVAISDRALWVGQTAANSEDAQ